MGAFMFSFISYEFFADAFIGAHYKFRAGSDTPVTVGVKLQPPAATYVGAECLLRAIQSFAGIAATSTGQSVERQCRRLVESA